MKITPDSSARAPFIYADGVACFGCDKSGVIRLELVAHTSVPEGTGARNELVVVAHLRFTRSAAALIRDAIDKSMDMREHDEQTIEPALSLRPN